MWGGLLGEMGSYVRWALTQGGLLLGYVGWPLMVSLIPKLHTHTHTHTGLRLTL